MIKIYNSPHYYNSSHLFENEIWMGLNRYPYLVSNMGRVFSIVKKIIRKPVLTTRMYHEVHLYKNGNKKQYSIHRLVAIYFIKNKNGKPQVNHKNADKLDNRAENLEWVTNQENRDHMVRLGLQSKGEGVCFSKLTECEVIYIRALHENGLKYDKLSEIYNVTSHTIYCIVTRRSWKHI